MSAFSQVHVSISNDRSIARQPINPITRRSRARPSTLALCVSTRAHIRHSKFNYGSCEIEFRVNECTLTRAQNTRTQIHVSRKLIRFGADTADLSLIVFVSYKRSIHQRQDRRRVYRERINFEFSMHFFPTDYTLSYS